jgi:hypothetical protein
MNLAEIPDTDSILCNHRRGRDRFNNVSAISWPSILLVEETAVRGDLL